MVVTLRGVSGPAAVTLVEMAFRYGAGVALLHHSDRVEKTAVGLESQTR